MKDIKYTLRCHGHVGEGIFVYDEHIFRFYIALVIGSRTSQDGVNHPRLNTPLGSEILEIIHNPSVSDSSQSRDLNTHVRESNFE